MEYIIAKRLKNKYIFLARTPNGRWVSETRLRRAFIFDNYDIAKSILQLWEKTDSFHNQGYNTVRKKVPITIPMPFQWEILERKDLEIEMAYQKGY